jgi:hydroxylamine dehydrogenase
MPADRRHCSRPARLKKDQKNMQLQKGGNRMKSKLLLLVLGISIYCVSLATSVWGTQISDDTQDCLACHQSVTPGIVADWKNSLHSHVSVEEAMKKAPISSRVSCEKTPKDIAEYIVGCAECHTANPDTHQDTFEHNGYKVHIVVTPRNCATCHPVEMKQYNHNIMSKAYRNLTGNPVYNSLTDSVNAIQNFDGTKAVYSKKVDSLTESDSCLFCHGTKINVKGVRSRECGQNES